MSLLRGGFLCALLTTCSDIDIADLEQEIEAGLPGIVNRTIGRVTVDASECMIRIEHDYDRVCPPPDPPGSPIGPSMATGNIKVIDLTEIRSVEVGTPPPSYTLDFSLRRDLARALYEYSVRTGVPPIGQRPTQTIGGRMTYPSVRAFVEELDRLGIETREETQWCPNVFTVNRLVREAVVFLERKPDPQLEAAIERYAAVCHWQRRE